MLRIFRITSNPTRNILAHDQYSNPIEAVSINVMVYSFASSVTGGVGSALLQVIVARLDIADEYIDSFIN